MKPIVEIEGRRIGASYRPFIVAEMSGNHNQSLDRALQIVEAAAHAGADALKIQTYTADTMTLDLREGAFMVDDVGSLWRGRSLYELYREAHTPWDWHQPIFERCRALGILPFSTPFDFSAVDFLEGLDVPCYKIASFENTDIPLIRKVASTGKPLIISTGMASDEELGETVTAARAAGCSEIVLLKCTSTYPADPANTNIRTIPDISSRFSCLAGLSDHTMGIGVAVASVALGAVLIEKHFTISRAEGGVDSAFSIEPDELRALVVETERAWKSLGGVRYGPTDGETASLAYRRSLYFVTDLDEGEVIASENIRAIRPGFGLAPRHYDRLLGMKMIKSVKRGTPVSWDVVKNNSD